MQNQQVALTLYKNASVLTLSEGQFRHRLDRYDDASVKPTRATPTLPNGNFETVLGEEFVRLPRGRVHAF